MRIALLAVFVIGVLSAVLFRSAGVPGGTWGAAACVVLGAGALLNALFLKLRILQPGKMWGERSLGLRLIGAGVIAGSFPHVFPDLSSSSITVGLTVLGGFSFIVGLKVEAIARKMRERSRS